LRFIRARGDSEYTDDDRRQSRLLLTALLKLVWSCDEDFMRFNALEALTTRACYLPQKW